MPDDVTTPETHPPQAEAPPAPAEHVEETPRPDGNGVQAATPETAPAEEGHAPEPAAEEAPAEETAAEEEAAEEESAEEEAPAAEGEGAAEEEAPAAAEEPSKKQWYVVKVQSGREESIKDAIERRIKIEGLEEYVGRIIIPVERVTEMRNSKRVVRTRKLYPGYLMVEVEFNDRILYLFRETSGVGDFVGGGVNRPPPPMPQKEVETMLIKMDEMKPTEAKVKPRFERGDRVRVKDGTFAGMEGEVKEILEAKNLARVELTIFGRPVPVELEYWQVELV
jgi:transcriptional antiterminator NusG